MRTQVKVPSAANRPPPAPRRPGRGFGRRVDQTLLRWQARLDAAWADRVVPWAGATVLFVWYFWLALTRADSLEPGSVLGSFAQAAWLISTGEGAEPTITGEHLLADHTPLVLWPIALVTRLLPTIPTLLGIQAAALAVGVVPLWRIARRVVHLRVGAAAALGVAYGLHPAVQNLNLADFHPQTLAAAPLLAATYYGLERRWRRFWPFAVVAVLCAAEVGLVVAGLGVLLVLEGHRRHGMRALAFGTAWTVVVVFVVQPVFGNAALLAPNAFGDYGESVLGVFGAMVTHPHQVLADVFAEADVRLLVGLLAPLLFLPLLAPRYLIPAMPLQFLALLAAVPLSGAAGAHHLVPTVPFAFVAATFALSRIGRRSVERVLVDRRVVLAVVLAAVGFFALDASSSPYRAPWNWGDDTPLAEAVHAAADIVGDTNGVRASPVVLPLLAERTRVYELDTSIPHAGRATRNVQAVVLDDRTIPRWTDEDQMEFSRSVRARGFELVYRNRGISVWLDLP
ncbi:MAG: DUF2079 domain-containing protein [Acidimicrobiales bacterium]